MIEYGQIEEASFSSEDIFIKIKGRRKHIEIAKWMLDDFETAKAVIIKELEKRKIHFVMY